MSDALTIGFANLENVTLHASDTLLDPQGALAHALDLLDGMRDKEQRRAAGDQLLDAVLALLLETEVANREGLVDDEYVRRGDRRDGKRNTGRPYPTNSS